MLKSILEWLNNAYQSSSILAIVASFFWGVLSILLSPCHLASIPLIIGYISGQETISVKRAFIFSLLFSFGILITIASIGIITGLLGRILGDIGKWGNYLVGIIFFIFGLYLLEIINISFLNPKAVRFKKKGEIGVFILGILFGIALGPCTFAYMAPMLAMIFKISTKQFFFALFLILFYAIGHCLIITVAGTSIKLVQNYLNWNYKSKGVSYLKKICGIFIILAGFYLFWKA
ncbi:MAG: cytochrome c biogenesis protein CcdA [candidate division WOR-3 bacterium]